MKNRIVFIKFTSLFLIVTLILSFVGCKRENDKTSSKNPISSSPVDESDNLNSDIEDDLFDSQSINLFDANASEEWDLKVYQTVKFDNVSKQNNYAGMAGILPPFWFVPDETMENPYTEEQLKISIKKFLQMGVTIVRAHLIGHAWAWDAENDKWDWDSKWMKGFYKYCDLMKENNIDIVMNPGEIEFNSITGLGLENPIPIIAKRDNPDIFNKFDAKSPTDEQKTIMLDIYGRFFVDFYNEVIVKRGYDNIKYIQPGTEPNNGNEDLSDEEIRKDYEDWVLSFSAAHNAMEKDGCRKNVKFIGPSVVVPYKEDTSKIRSPYMYLKWCVEEIDYMIDIYSAHQYSRPAAQTEDWTDFYHSLFIDPCKEIIKSTGKPLWCDEFNVGDDKYSSAQKIKEDPLSATQLAYGYMIHMVNGIQASPIWYLVDIKWPNTTRTTSVDDWEEGIHKCGVDTSVLESVIPRYPYYVYCMLGSTVQRGDTVYEGKSELGNVYSVMLKHKDGSYSFITVNFGYEQNVLTYKLPFKLKNATYEKTVYDPLTCIPNSLYQPIAPSKEIKNVTNSFTDTIGTYQVCVYNLKK